MKQSVKLKIRYASQNILKIFFTFGNFFLKFIFNMKTLYSI
jgi:hypothetical protein